MNRYQKVVLYGAIANVLLLLGFPPYDVIVFGRGAPMFDAFHPVFSVPANRVINGDLLYVLEFAVLGNAALAWLLLAGPREEPDLPRVAPQTLVVAFGMLNLVLVLLFPPMEAFALAQRITVGTFDGFYFAFGDKARRSIFVPLLYMEVLFVMSNACAFWLAMSIAGRSGRPAAAVPSPEAQAPAGAALDATVRADAQVLKRGEDRRKHADPNYKGPERRVGDRSRRARTG